jgi:transposase
MAHPTAPPADTLPQDVAALHSLVHALQQEVAHLGHQNELLRKMVFGRSSEKRAPEPDGAQGHLFLQEIAAEVARLSAEHRVESTLESRPATPASTPRKQGRRTSFPEHLPVVRTTCELRAEDRRCACGGELQAFGEEVSRELERVEIAVVHELARKKYACTKCREGVVTAPWRGKVIEKGLLGPGFLAHLITERFGNHLPYYRLEGKYRSEGLELARSVLCVSMARCAELLEPIAEELKREILASPVIHTDDTPVTIAQSGKGRSRQGRVWIYLSPEGRHWYDFTESRKRDGPARVFADYRGYIQADAYGGYDGLFVPGGAIEVACWAHLRRKFVEAEPTDPELARQALDQIQALFAIEAAAAELTDDGRRTLRQEQARPRVEAFQAWMERAARCVLPKSPLAQAIGYGRNQWAALTRYLEDGRLALSNNAAERAMRPFAVGRKNWLFFQRESGGKTASILMSLLMTAKAAGIEPRAYFRDVLLRISTESDVRKLTPHGWKEHFAADLAARNDEVLQRMLGKA